MDGRLLAFYIHELEYIGTSDPTKVINMEHRFGDAGVERMMIESEGIAENVSSWRTT